MTGQWPDGYRSMPLRAYDTRRVRVSEDKPDPCTTPARRRPSSIGFAIPIRWHAIAPPKSLSAPADEDLDFHKLRFMFLLVTYVLLSMFVVCVYSLHLSVCSLCKLVSPTSSLDV